MSHDPFATAAELGLMEGFPPPPDKRVDRTNALFSPPYNRWSYLNMRTIYPSAGIANADSSLKVFAGPRNDPFFMEFTGFTDAVAAVVGVGVVPDGTCPAVDGPTSGALVDLLTGGGTPVDTFAGATVQSLVVQIDTALVDEGGPILAIHGATYVKN